ncbi:MAG: hypothetical protein M3O03_10230 [Pseudomonadota bacterium]|nr:hypothetical protein [Pseudomonadota bacterium]
MGFEIKCTVPVIRNPTIIGIVALLLTLMFSGFEARAQQQPAGVSKAQVREFVAAYVRMRRVQKKRSDNAQKGLDKLNPKLTGELNGQFYGCAYIPYIILYNKYKLVVDSYLAKSPYDYSDVFKDKYETSISTDPFKIVVDIHVKNLEAENSDATAAEKNLIQAYTTGTYSASTGCFDYIKSLGLLER